MKDWAEWSTVKSDFEAKGFSRTYALAGRLCDELENRKACVVKIIHSEHEVAHQTGRIYKHVFKERGRLGVKFRVHSSSDLSPGFRGAADEGAGQTEDEEAAQRPTKGEKRTQIERILENLTKWAKEQQEEEEAQARCRGTRRAYVLVGHQPQLTQIARKLLRHKLPFVDWPPERSRRRQLIDKLPLGHSLPGDSLPIGNSEVACVELGEKPRLLWALTEKPEELLTDLKDKIKSKYDVAKFFLGAFAVNTGLLLNAGVWGQPELWREAPNDRLLAYAAVIAALVSLIFTAFTLFSYDSLLMPASLWSEPAEPRKVFRWSKLRWMKSASDSNPPKWSVSRPPSQAQLILYYEMMHVWTVFFMPAVISAFVAIGCLVLALVCRDAGCLPSKPLPPVPTWVIVDALAVLLLSLLSFYWRKKPRLGTED